MACEDSNWESFLSLLVPFNQGWASNASALIFLLSDTLMRKAEGAAQSHSHSFDTGAAWAQLGLQAQMLGYHAHGMTGIDFDRVRAVLAVPSEFRIEAATAIGRRTDPQTLPEGLRAREVPSGCKALDEIAFAGSFSG